MELNIPRNELSVKSNRVVEKAINSGANPMVVEEVIWKAMDLTAERRDSMKRNGICMGGEVVNRRELEEFVAP